MPTNSKNDGEDTVIGPGGAQARGKTVEVSPGQAANAFAPQTVVTPGGYRDPSLVHTIEPGYILDGTQSRIRKLVRESGAVAADFGLIAPRDRTKPLMPGNVHVRADNIAGLGAGWITYAYWNNNSGRPLSLFRAAWVVPPPPATQSGQTIFLFSGVQNSTMIYQPVLQWGPSGDRGDNYWAVASWYVDGQGGPAFKSPLRRVNPGDVLIGAIACTGQSGNGFTYDCEFEGISGTSLPIQNVQELTWCIHALEAYGLITPSEYPQASKTAFTSIEIRTGGQGVATQWTAETLVDDCGQHTVVVSDASPSGEVEIYYGRRSGGNIGQR